MNTDTEQQDQKAQDTTGALALRTAALQEMNAVEAGLAELEAKYKDVVYDVTTTKGMEDAKAARAEIRAPRYNTERIRQAKSSELTALRQEINDNAKRITARVLLIEAPVDEQIKAQEERKEAEREAKRAAEAERLAEQHRRLDQIRDQPLAVIGASASAIAAMIDALAERPLDDFDEVFLPTAEKTRESSLAAMRTAHAAAERLEAQQAELDQQRKEQEAKAAAAAEELRLANEAAAAERARLDAEAEAVRQQQAEADRLERERQDAERAERQAEEDAERERQAAAVKAEQDRVAAEQAEAQRQIDAANEAKRLEEEKAAKALQEAQERAIADAAAKAQAEALREQQGELEREAEHIRTVTLHQAAEDVVALLHENNLSDHVKTRALIAALMREPSEKDLQP